MMAAAMMGATAFQKGLGAIHALSHPIGAMHHTHHGATNAVCMPAMLQLNASAIRDRFDQAAGCLGVDGGFDGFCAFVDGFNDGFAVPKRLSDFGVKDPNMDRLVASALADPSCGGNPVELTAVNLRALFAEVL